MPPAKVKICGLTSAADALAAARAGADAIGFVFAASSRRVTGTEAARIGAVLPPFIAKVGVFVDATLDVIAQTATEAGLHVVQLHGNEDNSFIAAVRQLGYTVVKAVAVRDEAVIATLPTIEADALLLDKYDPVQAGGTGLTFDWRLAVEATQRLRAVGSGVPIILAGGLNPSNVQRALDEVNPYAVDVSSGVELTPGHKCHDKMHEFTLKVRQWHVNEQYARGS